MKYLFAALGILILALLCWGMFEGVVASKQMWCLEREVKQVRLTMVQNERRIQEAFLDYRILRIVAQKYHLALELVSATLVLDWWVRARRK